ncbi:hypothetical protein MNEG_12643 [Monoraphidium neglectum]|uniref:Uncharacterized protein n=1 Tax=Monoraphidium neglectum TaxID=145388 RepID=A0A0D2LUK1_9CHLO|nr:hypothetical protein MNEG_12643 [Monoraphidium neglectum]KIY95319.1 hypothetical protein MNEG_12643 [Monoraphidium neglectum]|eukprot:XP_013894339.1 hypothetical protein MNEG_12643 [Monoraphidium neglectum]
MGWVKHARTEVHAGAPRCGEPGPALCAEVNNTRPPRRVNQQVILPTAIDETQIAELLKPYAKAKLLHIAQPLVYPLLAASARSAHQHVSLPASVLIRARRPPACLALQPSLLFGGFKDDLTRSQFEVWIDTILAPWCCRTPADALKHGAMRLVRMRARRELAAPRPKQQPAADARRRRV